MNRTENNFFTAEDCLISTYDDSICEAYWNLNALPHRSSVWPCAYVNHAVGFVCWELFANLNWGNLCRVMMLGIRIASFTPPELSCPSKTHCLSLANNDTIRWAFWVRLGRKCCIAQEAQLVEVPITLLRLLILSKIPANSLLLRSRCTWYAARYLRQRRLSQGSWTAQLNHTLIRPL